MNKLARFEPLQIIRRGWRVLKAEFSAERPLTPLAQTDADQELTSLEFAPALNEEDSVKPAGRSPQAQTEPTNTAQTMPVKVSRTVSPISATILVLYLDDQQKSMTDPQILHGDQGQPVHLELKQFRNYYVKNIAGYTSTFTERYGVIKIHYAAKKAAPVWLLAKDLDDHSLLTKPEFIHGELNEPYSLVAPSFINYQLQQARGPVTGRFLERQQIVTYLYRQKLWREVDESLRLLQVTDFTACVSAPHGQTLHLTLAKNTLWQVFKSVTTTDDNVWYCLGGNTWVKQSDQTKLLDRQKYLTQAKSASQVPESYAVTLHAKATIDFIPGKKVALYDLPCGKKQDTLADGTAVKLTAQKNLSGMQWYCVADHGWILAEYLNFKHASK